MDLLYHVLISKLKKNIYVTLLTRFIFQPQLGPEPLRDNESTRVKNSEFVTALSASNDFMITALKVMLTIVSGAAQWKKFDQEYL